MSGPRRGSSGGVEGAVEGAVRGGLPGGLGDLIRGGLVRRAERALQGEADFIVNDPKRGYLAIDEKNGKFTVTPFQQGQISPEDRQRAITPQQLRDQLRAANQPATIEQSLRRATKADEILAGVTGRARDTDLADNQASLARTGRNIDHTPMVAQTRQELIGEFEQRLAEARGIKKKDHPEFFERDPQTGKSPKDALIESITGEINALKDADGKAKGLQGATTAYEQFLNPSAVAPAPTGRPNPLD